MIGSIFAKSRPRSFLRSPIRSIRTPPQQPQSSSFPMDEAIKQYGPQIIQGIAKGTLHQAMNKSRPDDMALCQGDKYDSYEKKKNRNHCCNDMGRIWCGGSLKRKINKKKNIKKKKFTKEKFTKDNFTKKKITKKSKNQGEIHQGKNNQEKNNKKLKKQGEIHQG